MSDDNNTHADAREEFLTARQLAAIMQVSEATVRRLARAGRIPSVRLTPRLIRFHLQSVREALDGATRSRHKATKPEPEQSPQLSFTDLL
ncbi:MAG: Helix-turn-helix domain [Blastocatellia bacterium]|jgi:excisionase family DNA binding protein|nr:Helix-turn-helix domain [Blastocatellia bacterium]